ncbi:MAG: M1 family metallopeptidase [Acidobacteria bacterium]|nr:M1 family metallopeptidase [Acidobacteriota bacterium]
MSQAQRPVHYDLRIEPQIDAARFTGLCVVTIDLLEPTDEIVMHAAELEIDRVSLIVGDETTPLSATVDEDSELLTLRCATVIPATTVRVEVSFAGTLNDKLRGFYRSTFTGDDGNEVVIATTQFQATDARRAFPCFDEPAFKASFSIELIVGSGDLAVSNGMEIERRVLDDERTLVRFDTTMKMSTYLVAFVVGPMEATEPRTVNGIDVRVVHRPGDGHLTSYALDVACHALEYFAEYYGIDYPASKLDLVAIPDFSFGAMENLGCVTFRDIYLLVDAENATRNERQNVASVINHEIAHMWFGDLVTMGWWNGIWLNEAFATFMETKATDAFEPDWDYWTSFAFGRSAALLIDALRSTRSVEYEVVSPSDAEAMFDVLTYQKGASVVRMLEQYLGESRFREGIRSYLTRHAYGNTETEDLWVALEEVSGEPVRELMDGWIFNHGYPVLSSKPLGDSICVVQRRFLADGSRDDDATWVVPIEWRDRVTAESGRALLSERETTLPITNPTELNSGAHGFYRVHRTPDEHRAIIESGFAGYGTAERYGLIDDAWVMVRSGVEPISAVIDLISGFSVESDPYIWRRIAACVAALDHETSGSSGRLIADWVNSVALGSLHRFAATSGEGATESYSVLFGLVGEYGFDSSLREQAPALIDDPHAAVSLRSAATHLVAATGNGAVLDEFIGRYECASNPQDRQRFLEVLSRFPAEAEFVRVLDYVLSDSVRTQDAPFVLRSMLAHRDLGSLAWARITQEWSTILERFPSNSITRMLEGIQALSTPASSAAVHAFLAERPISHGEKLIEQHLEQNRVNLAFRSRVAAELDAALS